MTHARIPDFSVRLPVTSTVDHVPPFADPILAVIDAHAEAYAVFQVATEGKPSEQAETAMDDALDALLAASCATRFGGLALLRHLRWWLGEEAEFAALYQPAYAQAQARADDLALFLGSDVSSLQSLGMHTTREAVVITRPDTAHVRAPRFLDQLGDLVSAFLIIAGGVFAYGFVRLA